MISGNLKRISTLGSGAILALLQLAGLPNSIFAQANAATQGVAPPVPAQVQPALPSPPPKSVWRWIWAEKPGRIPETVFFRLRFKLPKNALSARLYMSADDNFRAYFNESKNPILTGRDYSEVAEVEISRAQLLEENLLSVEAVNTGGPGGLLFRLAVRLPGNKTLLINSAKETRYSQRVPPDWTAFKLDDSKWGAAAEIAPAGGGVWGALHGSLQPDPTRIIRVLERPDTLKSGTKPLSLSASNRMTLSSNTTSPALIQMMSQAGFTLFQTDSNHLTTEETRANRWDFSELGTPRTSIQNLGLDWCYFPHLAFPPLWYRQTVPFTRLQCLEDKKPVEAFSIWDPTWSGFIERNYSAMAREFTVPSPKLATATPKQAPINTLYVGVHGDYGESGLLSGSRVNVPGQKEDWQTRFGNLHDHLGWWCDDPLARMDFRSSMLQKYGNIVTLNSVWKRDFKKSEEIDYPAAPRNEARREWLDFTEWYFGSVGKAIELNLSAARKAFPKTRMLISAGFGDENPRGGNDNSLIPKIASKYEAGVRSTHGGFKPFADNASTMFGRLGSACRFYDVPFWTEPPSTLNATQTVERIFESASQGAKGFFDWNSGAIANREVYFKYGKFLTTSRPIVDVALFYPAEAQRLKPNEGYNSLFAQAGAYIRDVTNFDIIDDRMVNDGCLTNFRVLVLMGGMMADQTTLDKIKTWVQEGGVLLAYDFGKASNFEGETPWYTDKGDLFGYIQQLAPATIRERYTGVMPSQYRLSIADPSFSNASDYLEDGWYAPETSGGISRRWTRATASVLLPVKPDSEYSLVIRALSPPEAAGKKRKVLLNGQEVGEIGAVGDITYRFLISDTLIGSKSSATLTFDSETITLGKDSRPLGVQIQSIQLVEKGEIEDGNSPPPLGNIRRELDLGKLNSQWAQRFGKGLTIYFPANRKLLKGYVEVIRRAVYQLSAIETGRKDALPIDNSFDGVYSTLFSDHILYYNSKESAVTKTLKIAPEMFAAWQGIVKTPEFDSWTVVIPPHGIEAIWFDKQPQELLFECEEFRQLNGFKPSKMADCSPGAGLTGVTIAKGGSISTKFVIETAGQYSIFSHCLRNSRLEIADILIDDQPLIIQNARVGRSVLNGTFQLSTGKHTLTLRARPDRDLRADYVILTNDRSTTGYDFALRRPTIE